MPSRAELTLVEPARGTASAPDTWSWRSTGYAWWVVIVLALGLTLSLMDRLIIALMIGPIGSSGRLILPRCGGRRRPTCNPCADCGT